MAYWHSWDPFAPLSWSEREKLRKKEIRADLLGTPVIDKEIISKKVSEYSINKKNDNK